MGGSIKDVVQRVINAEMQAIEDWLRKTMRMSPIEHKVTRDQFLTTEEHRFYVAGKQYGTTLKIKRETVDNKFKTTWSEED